jgi:hypothetical protein
MYAGFTSSFFVDGSLKHPVSTALTKATAVTKTKDPVILIEFLKSRTVDVGRIAARNLLGNAV